ncbi:MAG: hypothetical protein Q8S73_30615 [Deltaproteobacteria bacterium]|nr:hypothetical protein [Deltaproteobacteria bacterium]
MFCRPGTDRPFASPDSSRVYVVRTTFRRAWAVSQRSSSMIRSSGRFMRITSASGRFRGMRRLVPGTLTHSRSLKLQRPT